MGRTLFVLPRLERVPRLTTDDPTSDCRGFAAKSGNHRSPRQDTGITKPTTEQAATGQHHRMSEPTTERAAPPTADDHSSGHWTLGGSPPPGPALPPCNANSLISS